MSTKSSREQIAEVLAERWVNEFAKRLTGCPPDRALCIDFADALMPLFEAAVQQARNDALEEAAELWSQHFTHVTANLVRALKSDGGA